MKSEVAFVHVPKTGGASILRFCRKHGISVINHNIRDKNRVSLTDFKSLQPTCFTFCFVRNPWDRLVSTYFYLKNGGNKEEDRKDAELYLPQADFRSFVLDAFKSERVFEQMHLRPQYTWLSNKQGLIVDNIGRFEDLQGSFNTVCSLIKLPNYRLPHKNKSNHKPYRNYYDAEMWEIVRSAYEKDVELFGYDSTY
jgi:hypothetical protein